jgi:hypothetical protein
LWLCGPALAGTDQTKIPEHALLDLKREEELFEHQKVDCIVLEQLWMRLKRNIQSHRKKMKEKDELVTK